MGQQYSVETLSTTDTIEGGRYWSSFEPYPYKVGRNKLCYLGLLNGRGRRSGEKCMVKAYRNGCGTFEDWQYDIMKARIARDYAAKFKEEMTARGIDVTLNFIVPMIADIDEVSSFMCISFFMKKPLKKMREYEAVSIEPYFDGRFEDFEYGSVRNFDAAIAHAFSHYTWYRSCGDLLITRLQGVQQLDKYHLTIPTVHSPDRRYAHRDGGSEGIEDFFANHRCNDLCRLWARPDNVMRMPSLSNSEMDMITIQMQNISQYSAKQIEPQNMSSNDVFIMRNYPIRMTDVIDNHCACAYFGLPCSHIMNNCIPSVMCTTNKALSNDAFV